MSFVGMSAADSWLRASVAIASVVMFASGCATEQPSKFYSSRLTSHAVQASESANEANKVAAAIKADNERTSSALRSSGDRVETAERFAKRLGTKPAGH